MNQDAIDYGNTPMIDEWDLCSGAFACNNCGLALQLLETDYYDFDHYICRKCGEQLVIPAWEYGEPDEYEDDDDWY